MVARKKIRLTDRPFVQNYPELWKWLQETGARNVVELPVGDLHGPGADGYMFPERSLQQFLFPGGGLCWIEVRAFGKGWEIYTATQSARVTATLVDAEKRLGLHGGPWAAKRSGK